LVLAAMLMLTNCTGINRSCSPNWKITGYYTPIESQFDSSLNQPIKIEQFKSTHFNTRFIKAVKMEGWGKTRFGWYLGYYNDLWHKRNTPLNSLGQPLTVGSVAVDNRIIGKGKRLHIPFVQGLLNVESFIANDVGSAIKKYHIDIYTGEGDQARLLTYKISGKQKVCIL
jgi:3D (Asp-Asp-Asp) domain-containing protein